MSLTKIVNSNFYKNMFGDIPANNNIKDFLYNYFIAPINNALIGFAIFFTIIFGAKIFEKLFLASDISYITIEDISTASIGLMIFGLGRIIITFIYSIRH